MEFVDLKDYEEYYLISKNGIIKSKEKIVNYIDGRNRHYKSKVMKTYMGSDGYERIRLTVNKTSKLYAVHRLLALNFIEPIIGKNYVNHKDENKLNNSLDNLEWVTNQENMLYSSRRGSNPSSTPCIQIKDGIILNEYTSIHEASRQTNISCGNINSVLKGNRNYAGGYQWKYKEGDIND